MTSAIRISRGPLRSEADDIEREADADPKLGQSHGCITLNFKIRGGRDGHSFIHILIPSSEFEGLAALMHEADRDAAISAFYRATGEAKSFRDQLDRIERN